MHGRADNHERDGESVGRLAGDNYAVLVFVIIAECSLAIWIVWLCWVQDGSKAKNASWHPGRCDVWLAGHHII